MKPFNALSLSLTIICSSTHLVANEPTDNGNNQQTQQRPNPTLAHGYHYHPEVTSQTITDSARRDALQATYYRVIAQTQALARRLENQENQHNNR